VTRAAELFDLAGRVALVTGASSGIGNRFARTFALNGARVVAVARRADRLETLVAEIRAAGGAAIAHVADVRDHAAMAGAFDAAEKAFGTVTIHINNAGIAPTGRVLDQPSSTWRDVMDVNLDAVYFNAQLAAQRMVAAKTGGAIINVASILGFSVFRTLSAYAVAKAGVIQLTKAMALELASRKIRVNTIAPGYIHTELNHADLSGEFGQQFVKDIPLGRFGEVGDLDGAILLLASDAGRFMTGATLVVDGGHTASLQNSVHLAGRKPVSQPV
jgi:3-oxoacyl-[acyl-carrier protein] reductase